MWNLERSIFFQTVILQRSQRVTASHAIGQWIENRFDMWEAGRHGVLVEETLSNFRQYLTTARRE